MISWTACCFIIGAFVAVGFYVFRRRPKAKSEEGVEGVKGGGWDVEGGGVYNTSHSQLRNRSTGGGGSHFYTSPNQVAYNNSHAQVKFMNPHTLAPTVIPMNAPANQMAPEDYAVTFSNPQPVNMGSEVMLTTTSSVSQYHEHPANANANAHVLPRPYQSPPLKPSPAAPAPKSDPHQGQEKKVEMSTDAFKSTEIIAAKPDIPGLGETDIASRKRGLRFSNPLVLPAAVVIGSPTDVRGSKHAKIEEYDNVHAGGIHEDTLKGEEIHNKGLKKGREEPSPVNSTSAVISRSDSFAAIASEDSTISDIEKYPTVSLSDLKLERVLGGGGFGQVWKGEWRGTPVAVKILSPACQGNALPESELKAFQDEVCMLARLRHPNVCLFLAACLEPKSRAIVTELLLRGSLWDMLRTPKVELFAGFNGPTYWPSWAMRKVLEGTCRGLIYLHSHSPPIIHRDLKSANLLLDESFNVKICDFGLARLRNINTAMTANVGTLHWMAPEVISGIIYTESADIFSLGIIAWEILTGQCPYESEGLSQIDIAIAVVKHNKRPILPACTPQQAQLIHDCWAQEPNHRPSAVDVLSRLALAFPFWEG